MNRFEIIFRQLDEAADVARAVETEADAAEIRSMREDSDAVEAIMRVSREISQQTACACFTSS